MASSQFKFPVSTEEKKSTTTPSMNISSSSTPAVLSSLSNSASSSVFSEPLIHHNPAAENELMPIHIPSGVTNITLDYWDGDSDTQKEKTDNSLSIAELQQLLLLGGNVYDRMARRAARLILSGEEKDVEELVTMIKNNPALLDYEVEEKDRHSRPVKQKLLEMAIMAGDVDLKEGITKGKEHGIAERLIIAGNVSKERIAKAKEVVTSEEAIRVNEARNKRILDAIKKFGESIIKIQPNEEEKDEKTPYSERFKSYQSRCQTEIDQLEKDLKSAQNEMITLGYIFDPKILQMTAEWFQENVNRFGGWWSLQSEVFGVNGYGTLQFKLSSRDAQVTRAGIANLVDNKVVPARTLNNTDGTSYFNSSSGLGRDFCLGIYGWAVGEEVAAWRCFGFFGKLMSSKNNSIAKLMQLPFRQSNRCSIM